MKIRTYLAYGCGTSTTTKYKIKHHKDKNMPKEIWCNQQHQQGEELVCCAHMNEARCFTCPYTKQDIVPGKGFVAPGGRDTLEGACWDYEPICK